MACPVRSGLLHLAFQALRGGRGRRVGGSRRLPVAAPRCTLTPSSRHPPGQPVPRASLGLLAGKRGRPGATHCLQVTSLEGAETHAASQSPHTQHTQHVQHTGNSTHACYTQHRTHILHTHNTHTHATCITQILHTHTQRAHTHTHSPGTSVRGTVVRMVCALL